MTASVSEKHILGLELGPASIGWALLVVDESNYSVRLLRSGVRIFEPGSAGTPVEIREGRDHSKAADRRIARLQRRKLHRRAQRKRDLFRLLQGNGLLPLFEGKLGSDSAQRHAILNDLDRKIARTRTDSLGTGFGQLPLHLLRKIALDRELEVYELGRVLFHLAQRRGFLARRREGRRLSGDGGDIGQIEADIRKLESEIQTVGARTLGEYLTYLDPHSQRVRRRWTSREMYRQEFDEIWKVQSVYHPALLTWKLHDAIATLSFSQRDVSKQKHLVGRCELEFAKARAAWAINAAQRFRILQGLNRLKRIDPVNLEAVPLAEQERKQLFSLLDRNGPQTFREIRAHLAFADDVRFNLERGKQTGLVGNRTQSIMLKIFGERWDTFSEGKRNQIIENWRMSESRELLTREAVEHWGLDETAATSLANQIPEDGYCPFSASALSKLLPCMQSGALFQEAKEAIYGNHISDDDDIALDKLPSVRSCLASFNNPAMERTLTETRKVVNAIIREYGKPHEIEIELLRELKSSRKEREEAGSRNRRRKRERDDVVRRIALECGLDHPSREEIEKALLQVECGGICPYTGKNIPFANLFRDTGFVVRHILPLHRYFDDSFQNKVLCYLPGEHNSTRDQIPFEIYGSDEGQWIEILARVRDWPLPNRGKLKRFMLRTDADLNVFTAHQRTDTSYMSGLVARFLNNLYGRRNLPLDRGGKRKAVSVWKGAVTRTIRRRLGLEDILQKVVAQDNGRFFGEPRFDHRRHAVHALAVGLTRLLIAEETVQASLAEQELQHGENAMRGPWEVFTSSIQLQIEGILASYRPEHRISGELHKGSNYSRPHLYMGKSTVHRRCLLTDLSIAAIEAEDVIVDPTVRNAIRAKVTEIGGDPKAFGRTENLPCLIGANGEKVLIRKARIRETRNPLKVGTGLRERFVLSGGIHHISFFTRRGRRNKEQWDAEVVPITEAYERRRNKMSVVSRSFSEASGMEFLFSVMKGDTVQIADEHGTYVVRVKKFNERKQLWFVPLNDDHNNSMQMDLGIARSKSPNALKDLRTRKVTIDLLGSIVSAND